MIYWLHWLLSLLHNSLTSSDFPYVDTAQHVHGVSHPEVERQLDIITNAVQNLTAAVAPFNTRTIVTGSLYFLLLNLNRRSWADYKSRSHCVG